MADARVRRPHGGIVGRHANALLAGALVVVLSLSLAAFTSAPAEAAKVTAGQAAAYYARTSLLNRPYAGGAREERRFDCSGSTYLAWRHVLPGVVGSGSSRSQYQGPGTKIRVGRDTTLASSDLNPGDLLFWSDTGKAEDIDHVAIYLGYGRILQTANGRNSWIGKINDNKSTRMKYALRPAGADKTVSKIDFDVFDAGFTDEFRYGDFNGDGFEDVLWFTGTNTGDVTRYGWQVSYGSPTGMGPFVRVKGTSVSPINHQLTIGDFDGDGADDVLWFTGRASSSSAARKGWQVAYGRSGGFTDFMQVKASTSTPAKQRFAFGDFDGDGADDVLWFTGTTKSDAKFNGWQLASGTDSGFSKFTKVRNSALSPATRDLAYGDFNGDGTDDVLWFTGTVDKRKTYTGWQMIYGSPEGFGGYVRVKGSTTTSRTKRFTYGDFDGDGADDVLWFTGTVDPNLDFVGWQMASGTSTGFTQFAYVKRSVVSTALYDLAYGDFNGDGADDVLWFTGIDGSAGGYSGWQASFGSPSGFSYFRRVSDSAYTSYEQ